MCLGLPRYTAKDTSMCKMIGERMIATLAHAGIDGRRTVHARTMLTNAATGPSSRMTARACHVPDMSMPAISAVEKKKVIEEAMYASHEAIHRYRMAMTPVIMFGVRPEVTDAIISTRFV